MPKKQCLQEDSLVIFNLASRKDKCNKKGNKNPMEHAIMVVMTQIFGQRDNDRMYQSRHASRGEMTKKEAKKS
jgi:hypothetical protein